MAHQTLLSFPVSWSFLRFMFIESVMLSNHLILCQPLLFLPSIFPSIRVFPKSWLFASGVQNFGASVSASVLLMNIQVWFPLGLTGLISLKFKGLSRVFSSTTISKHQFFSHQPSLRIKSHNTYLTTGISSVTRSCPILWDQMDYSTPGLPVHHQFPEFIQTHVHWVSDAIQSSHPLLSPSPPAFNLSQHQCLF